MTSNEEFALQGISRKLDALIRLSALNLVKDIKIQKDQISILSDAGFFPKQIADILGTNNNVVSVTLNSLKKKRGELESKDKKVEENSLLETNENE
jgi:hypothetical protein